MENSLAHQFVQGGRFEPFHQIHEFFMEFKYGVLFELSDLKQLAPRQPGRKIEGCGRNRLESRFLLLLFFLWNCIQLHDVQILWLSNVPKGETSRSGSCLSTFCSFSFPCLMILHMSLIGIKEMISGSRNESCGNEVDSLSLLRNGVKRRVLVFFRFCICQLTASGTVCEWSAFSVKGNEDRLKTVTNAAANQMPRIGVFRTRSRNGLGCDLFSSFRFGSCFSGRAGCRLERVHLSIRPSLGIQHLETGNSPDDVV